MVSLGPGGGVMLPPLPPPSPPPHATNPTRANPPRTPGLSQPTLGMRGLFLFMVVTWHRRHSGLFDHTIPPHPVHPSSNRDPQAQAERPEPLLAVQVDNIEQAAPDLGDVPVRNLRQWLKPNRASGEPLQLIADRLYGPAGDAED